MDTRPTQRVRCGNNGDNGSSHPSWHTLSLIQHPIWSSQMSGGGHYCDFVADGECEVPALEDDRFWPGALSGGRENIQAIRESF